MSINLRLLLLLVSGVGIITISGVVVRTFVLKKDSGQKDGVAQQIVTTFPQTGEKTSQNSVLPETEELGNTSTSVPPIPSSINRTYNSYTTSNVTNNANTTNTTNMYDLSAITHNRLLFINDHDGLEAISAGSAGQFLVSSGAGVTPTWGSSNSSVDWASPGAIGGTTPSTGVFTGLTAAGTTTPLKVGTGNPFQVLDTGRLELAYVGDAGYLSASGGAIFLNNTSNTGTGIGIYSNAGAEAFGNMINVKVDNAAYAQAAFYMNYDGTSNAVEIVSNSDDTSSNALAVTGNNINDSTLGIIGYELGRGTIKISHYRPGSGNDQNASAISIDLKGSGTRAQGLYVDSTETGGTLGNLLRLRNESIDKFVVNYQGNLTMAGNLTIGAYGTDSTYTKYGNTTGDQFFVGTNGAFRVSRAASNSEAFRVQINGDTQGRWLGTSDGRLKWGDGVSAQDITLRRGAAGLLYLDGAIDINTSNGDYDTIIKGVNDSSLFYVDASTDSIGIGTSTPLSPLNIRKNSGGSPNLIVNQLGAGDLLSLEATGSAKLSVTNAGNIVSVVGAGWRPASDATTGLQVQTSNGTGFVTFDTTNQRVGIGIATPGAPLHVFGGDIWLENNQAYRIKDSGGSARSVLAYTSGNNVQLYNYAATGVLQIGINNASNTTGNIRFFTGNNTERVRIDPAGLGIGATSFGTSASNVLAIASSVAPSTSITDGIQLFAVDVAGNHELRVRDEAGNITTLSPHNFSAIPEGPSEDLAWAFYSERNGKAINADMTKALRIVEQLSGQQVLYFKDLKTGEYVSESSSGMEISNQNLTDQFVLKADLSKFVELVDSAWIFLRDVTFKAKANFQAGITVWGQAVFKGNISVNEDTAGSVIVPAGAQGVTVHFEHAYTQTPSVYITPMSVADVKYGVTETSKDSFQVRLLQPVAQDVEFHWLALMVDPKSGGKTEVIGSQPSPSLSPLVSPSPEVAGAHTEATAEPSISPSISPTPSSSASVSATPAQ